MILWFLVWVSNVDSHILAPGVVRHLGCQVTFLILPLLIFQATYCLSKQNLFKRSKTCFPVPERWYFIKPFHGFSLIVIFFIISVHCWKWRQCHCLTSVNFYIYLYIKICSSSRDLGTIWFFFPVCCLGKPALWLKSCLHSNSVA